MAAAAVAEAESTLAGRAAGVARDEEIDVGVDLDAAAPGRGLGGDAAGRWAYLTAGQAIVTVETEVGARYTYRIARKKDGSSPLFASVLTGPNNLTDYTYAGLVQEDGTLRPARPGRGLSPESPSVQALARLLAYARRGTLPPGWTLRHAGRCARCKRTLTTPESLETGLGPECAERV